MDIERLSDDDLGARLSGWLARHADGPDPIGDGAVEEVLHGLRQRLGLDVVFVAEFAEGERVFRFVDRAPHVPPIEPGMSHPLEASFCVRIADGRLPEFIPDVARLGPEVDLPPVPFPIGTHLGTPVLLKDGSRFGTLCCFSLTPNAQVREEDLGVLRHCASLVAHKLGLARAAGLRDPMPSRLQAQAASYASPIWNLGRQWELTADSRNAWLDA